MPSPPSSIGRYEVVRPIGQGGMGALYLAWDPKLDRQLAIKLLKDDDDELRERFSREARAVARLRHPHIVTIFDVGEHDDHPFIAMEFVQGETMLDVIKHRKHLPLARKIELIEELCDGLGFAHKAGIVHRDIKPANIMVDSEGSLKILDFGIARAAESVGMTQAGMLIGTLNYMSPEQVSGKVVDHRSDLFAVGTVFYELVSFHQAFPGNLLGGILNKIMNEPPEPLAELVRGVNPEVIRIINRAIEKNPDHRYQDLSAMRKELLALRSHMQSGESPTQVIDSSMLPIPRPSDPKMSGARTTPRRSADLEELARRRTGQIQGHLDSAASAIAAGDFEGAITSCEHVLLLDASDARALEMLDRARTALEHREAEALLESAESELSRGALTSARGFVDQAALLDPEAPLANQLKQSVEEAFAAREKTRVREAAIHQALDRGQARLQAGAFDEAEAAADEVLSIDAAHAAALTLKTRASEARLEQARAALERRAHEAVTLAEQQFARGERDEAVAALSHFAPAHGAVSRVLETMKATMARDAARAATFQREMNSAAELHGRGDWQAALAHVNGALAAEPGHAAARDLKAAIDREIHAAADRARAEQHRQDQIAAAMKRARKAHPHEAAIAVLRDVLQLDPDHAEARQLIADHQQALQREQERAREIERQAREREPTISLPVRGIEAPTLPAKARAAKPAPPVKRVDPETPTDPTGPTGAVPIVPAPKAATARTMPPVLTETRRIYLGVGALVLVGLIYGVYKMVSGPSTPETTGNNPAPTPSVSASATPTPPVGASPSPVATTPGPTQTPAATSVARGATPTTTPAAAGAGELQKQRELAKKQYDSGDRAGAVATVMNGLKLYPADSGLVRIADNLKKDAQELMAKSQSAADAVGTAATSNAKYQDAKEAANRASAKNTALDEALRQYKTATDLFDKAAEEGRRAPAATAAPPPPPPPTSTPTPTPAIPVASASGASGTAVPSAGPPVRRPTDAEEQASIHAVLAEYARAYGAKDVDAVMKVFPRQDRTNLQTAYRANKSQSMTLSNEKVVLAAGNTKATLTCTVNYVFQGPAGGTQKPPPASTVFQFEKQGDRWQIVSSR